MNKKYLDLFITFFKIGAFTFGGGYAMIPLISREVVDNKNWMTEEEILEVVAIAESSPGPIAINAATFVGYKVAGFWGAILSTLGVVLPSILIIMTISLVLQEFKDSQLVTKAFAGIRIGVLALIVKALWTMYKQANKSIFSYLIMFIAFMLVAIFKVNVLLVILISAFLGLVSSTIISRRKDK